MKHTLSPIVTGSSVIGMKYNGGVILAADTLASYGSQKRYKDVSRLRTVGKYSLLGASGEMSDFQYMGDLLDELDTEDWLNEDGCSMGPHEYGSYIGRVMYNRRNKMNPLYNQFIVAGKKSDGPPMLAYVDHQGTYFEEDFVATGFGGHLAIPILRNEWRADISLEEAKKLCVKCLQLCFYRDCRAYNRIQFATSDGQSTRVEEPFAMDHFWGHTMWTRKTLEGSSSAVTSTW